jgi:hypothetical protein
MKQLKLDNIREDAVASAMYNLGSDSVSATGYVCRADKESISLSSSKDASVVVEYPRSAIVGAFSDEATGLTTLIVKSGTKTRTISSSSVESGPPAHALLKPSGRKEKCGKSAGQSARSPEMDEICDGYLDIARQAIEFEDWTLFNACVREYRRRC